MASLGFIKPTDQPTGVNRLLDHLHRCLDEDDYSEFWLSVAYAKVGPLLRLDPKITSWRQAGKNIRAIYGVDQKGTSVQALEYSLQAFNEVYITFSPAITFHPKIYLFFGPSKAELFIGSNNLTVGGTEQNFEACVHLEYDLTSDEAEFVHAKELYECLLPSNFDATHPLTEGLLHELSEQAALGNEKDATAKAQRKAASSSVGKLKGLLPSGGFKPKPPSSLPKAAMKGAVEGAKGSKETSIGSVVNPEVVKANGLVIQIIPHHNGEIFLSKTAVNQNPNFFGWPFTGTTTPKIGQNVGYPQREPDPIVNITVIGASSTVLLQLDKYELNTVFYSRKSEIRITASPLVEVVPELSIMVMQDSEEDGVDYELVIHTPDSPDYSTWLASCNQNMPNSNRSFGWI